MLDTMDFSQSSAGKQYDEVHLGSETLLENTRLGSSLVTCDTEIEADLDKQRFIEIVMWIRDDKKEKISNKQLKDKFEMEYDRANRFLQMLEDAGIISGQKKGTKLPRTVNQDKLVLYPVNFNAFCITFDCPGMDLLFETFQVRKWFSQGLATHDTDFYLCHVQPAPMLWRIMPLKSLRQSACFRRRKCFV